MKPFFTLIFMSLFFTTFSQTTQNRQLKLQKSAPLPSQNQVVFPIINPSLGDVFIKEKGTRNPAADRYILDNKKLTSYFKKAKIPTDFPIYDSSISFDDNKHFACVWARKHKYLFKKEYRELIKKESKQH